jgi:pilus assembly protein Flp/PilA
MRGYSRPRLAGYVLRLHQYERKEWRIMLFDPKERGQGLVEYALILVLVAVVVIVILVVLGPAIGNVFSNIVANI